MHIIALVMISGGKGAGAGVGGAAALTQQPRHALGARGWLATRLHAHASHEHVDTVVGHAGVPLDGQLAKAAHGVGLGVGAEGGGCHQAGSWKGGLALVVGDLVVVVGHSSRGCTNHHHNDDKQKAQGLGGGGG